MFSDFEATPDALICILPDWKTQLASQKRREA
jgi:hypothetical protein